MIFLIFSRKKKNEMSIMIFSVSQPSIMFSYKAQMDETMEDDQVSLPHQQSFSSLKTDSDYIYQVKNQSIVSIILLSNIT